MPNNKECELNISFLPLPVELQRKIADLLDCSTCFAFLQLNKACNEWIVGPRKAQLDSFNKQFPVCQFHIRQYSPELRVFEDRKVNVFNKRVPINNPAVDCVEETSSSDSDCDDEGYLTYDDTPLTYRKRNERVLKINHNNDTVFINPSTVFFDPTGAFAAGYPTDIKGKACRYIFSWPSCVVVRTEEKAVCAKEYEKEYTICDAVTDGKRTFCFFACMQVDPEYMGYVTGKDINYVLCSWSKHKHWGMWQMPSFVRIKENGIVFCSIKRGLSLGSHLVEQDIIRQFNVSNKGDLLYGPTHNQQLRLNWKNAYDKGWDTIDCNVFLKT